MKEACERIQKATQWRMMAYGYRVLKRNKAELYGAAAKALERNAEESGPEQQPERRKVA